MKDHNYYINEAIKEAQKADQLEEIPVGAIVVDKEGKIIGRGYNKKEKTYNVISHAEIEAITKANKKIKNWRLIDCTMYVTLEPCEMCKKVIEEAKIIKIYYLLDNNSLIKEKAQLEKIDNKEMISKYKTLFDESFKKIRKIFPGK